MEKSKLSSSSRVPLLLGLIGLTVFLLLSMTTVDAKGRSPLTLMSYDGGKTFCRGPMAACNSEYTCCPVLETGVPGNYSCVSGVCCLPPTEKCYYDGECCDILVCGGFDPVTGLGSCNVPT